MSEQVHYDLSDVEILVVEKHLGMRNMIRRVLREMGIEHVRATSDTDEAFAMLREFQADIIFTDWAPDLDGISFLKRLRTDNDSPNPFVPVIVISAFTGLDHVCTARDNGMTEYLAKPVSAAQIYSRIRAAVENRRKFVRNDNFFGPDRRRRPMEFGGDERRAA